jgi:hypothetical protein
MVEEHGYSAMPPSKVIYCHCPILEVDSFLNKPVSSLQLWLQHQASHNAYASATDYVNSTSGWTTTYLVYQFAQQVNKLVLQTEPSAHEHKDISREEGRIWFFVKLQLCQCSLKMHKMHPAMSIAGHLEVGNLDNQDFQHHLGRRKHSTTCGV